jgi:hypothetical protein
VAPICLSNLLLATVYLVFVLALMMIFVILDDLM